MLYYQEENPVVLDKLSVRIMAGLKTTIRDVLWVGLGEQFWNHGEAMECGSLFFDNAHTPTQPSPPHSKCIDEGVEHGGCQSVRDGHHLLTLQGAAGLE